MKKAVSLLLVFCILFLAPATCLAIGEQSSKDWNLFGDVESEKEMEGQLFSIVGLAAFAAAPVAGPFTLFSAGTGGVSLALGQIAKPEHATWENWPMSRYVFHHSPVGKYTGPVAVGEKIQGSVGDMVANMIFDITKALTRLSINLMVLAFNTDIITGMIGWISDGVSNIFTNGELFPLLMTIGIIFLLIYATFRFLRGQAMTALSATLIAALAVGGVFFFTANAQQIIGSISKTTDDLAGVFLGAVSGYTSAEHDINIDNPRDRGLVAAGQTTWEGVVARPWAVTLFGTADKSKLKLTQDEFDELDKSVFPDASLNKIQPGMRIDTLFLGTTGDGRDAVAEALGRPNAKFLWKPHGGKEIDHGQHPGTVVGFMPGSVGTHIKTACLTLFPAISLMILAGTVAISILVCQAVLAVLLLVLPIALFALMIPDTGWKMAGQYFKTVIGFFMVKLIYGLYLSLTLTVSTGLTKPLLEGNVGLSMVIMAVIFLGAALYRKKALNLVFDSINKGKATLETKIDTQKIIKDNTRRARKLGISDAVTDWWFSARRGGGMKSQSLDTKNATPNTRNSTSGTSQSTSGTSGGSQSGSGGP